MVGTFFEFWAPILAWAGFSLVWALAAYGAERLTRDDDSQRRTKDVIASL